jgi:hypothetical protein
MIELTIPRLIILFFILAFLSNGSGFSQNENTNWHFGYGAGIRFAFGTSVRVNDGQMNGFEGFSSISSADGTLLFYTNGIESRVI